MLESFQKFGVLKITLKTLGSNVRTICKNKLRKIKEIVGKLSRYPNFDISENTKIYQNHGQAATLKVYQLGCQPAHSP